MSRGAGISGRKRQHPADELTPATRQHLADDFQAAENKADRNLGRGYRNNRKTKTPTMVPVSAGMPSMLRWI